MATRKTKKGSACCGSGNVPAAPECCSVDAVITIDSRGQLVLPKDVRDKAGIKSGDKLAVISWNSDGETFAVSLIKADDFAETVRKMLGPMMKEIMG